MTPKDKRTITNNMKFPKTIKGYILLMRTVERFTHLRCLKGFDELSPEDQENLLILDAEISNSINEVIAYPDEETN